MSEYMEPEVNQFSRSLRNSYRKFNSFPSHTKVIAVLLLVLSLPVAVYLVRTFRLFQSRAANVQLSFNPSSATVSPDARLSVMLNAGSSRVAFARAVVRFDRTKVRVADVTVPSLPGSPNTSTGLYKPVLVTTPSQANGNGTGTGEVVMVLVLCGDRDPSCDTSQRPTMPTGNFALASIRFTPVSGQTGNTTVSYNLADVQIVEDNQAEMAPSGSNATLTLSGVTPTPGACGTRAGDTNNDNVVDILDIGNVVRAYGSNPVSNACADLDHNNTVDILDIGIVVRNYGN